MDDSTAFRFSARSSPAYLDIGTLTLLALLLNLVHLGTRSIVFDEATSANFARFGFIPLLHVIGGGDPNMGLYYALLNLWVRLFGQSEAAVRSLSAIFGALAVSAIYLLGTRLFGRMVGVIAGVLLALDAFIVEYAQTARSYSMVVFLVTLSAYFLVVELEQPSKRNRIAYVLTSILAIYAHYFAVYVLVAHLVTVTAMRRRAALTREWLEVAAAIVILCTPAAIIAYHGGGTIWIRWIEPPSLNDIAPNLVDLAGGSSLLLILLLAGGCYGTVCAIRERRYWPTGFITAWLILPVVFSFAVSMVWPMFLSRYLIICVPALILFGTSALARVRSQIIAAALAVPIVWLTATNLAAYYRSDQGEDWRDATRYVLAATHPGDGIVFYPDYAHKPFDYYQRRSDAAGPANLAGQSKVERNRIWFVIRKSDAGVHLQEVQQVQTSMAEHYRMVDRHGFRGVGVELYAK